VTTSASNDQHRWLVQARELIDRDVARPPELATLARLTSMSPVDFTRAFRASFGESPHRYLQRRRIERAMTLLQDHRFSVLDSCFAVGFSSPVVFSRIFHAIAGVPPAQYRAGQAARPASTRFVQPTPGRGAHSRPAPSCGGTAATD
jgi:transcriptional regulator GlxA family with amidase domain